MTAAEATDKKNCIWNCRERAGSDSTCSSQGAAELGEEILPWLLHFILMAVAGWVHCLGFSSSYSPWKQQDKASSEVLLQTEISRADLAGLIHRVINPSTELLVLPPASSCSSPERAHPRTARTGIAPKISSYISTFACVSLALQEPGRLSPCRWPGGALGTFPTGVFSAGA